MLNKLPESIKEKILKNIKLTDNRICCDLYGIQISTKISVDHIQDCKFSGIDITQRLTDAIFNEIENFLLSAKGIKHLRRVKLNFALKEII